MTNLIVIGVLILAALSAFGAWTLKVKNDAIDAYKAEVTVKEAELAAAQQKIVADGETKIIDMQAAYDAGEASAAGKVKTIYVRGQQNVARDSGLSNPQCVMSDDSLRYLRGALAGMRTASVAGESAPAVSGAGASGGGDVQRALPQQPPEHGTVGPVHAAPRPDGDGVPLPTTGSSAVRGHPKPKPIGK